MNRLWVRLTIGFLLVTLTLLLLVTLVVHSAVQSSFSRYVTERDAAIFGNELEDELVAYYASHGSWAGSEALLPVAGRGLGGRMGRGMQTYVADPDGVVVAATNPAWVGQSAATIGVNRSTQLLLDGIDIGMLGQQTPGGQALAMAEARFANQINQALAAISVVAALIAVGAGVLLSYSLARPLQRLAESIRAVTAVQLGEQVVVEGPTEVRELAGEFNALSGRLAYSERQRQQMTTDVAHELRTPVTVLRGHLEAMMDGVYALDVEHLAVAYDQTIHLSRLVEDLRLLTQAEAGRLALHLQPVTPEEVVAAAAARFAPLAQDAEIRLSQSVEPKLPHISVDPGRLQQVFDNLLTNALRHTEPGGAIEIMARRYGGGVRLSVSNTGELPQEQLDHLFDRFWRGAEARRRDVGGSGLGLAITRQLILLQHGTIRAEAHEGTTSFVLDLPSQSQSSSNKL